MRVDPLAAVYARSLVDLAREANRLEALLEEARGLRGLLERDRELRTFIESPAISEGAKREVLERAFRGRMDDLLLNFLCLVVKRGRQFLLPEMLAGVEDLYDEAVGRVRVEAVTAVPLDALEGELRDALHRSLGREVVLVNKVRPELLGGLVLRWGDLVADGSVRAALEKVGSNMLSHKPGSETIHEDQP